MGRSTVIDRHPEGSTGLAPCTSTFYGIVVSDNREAAPQIVRLKPPLLVRWQLSTPLKQIFRAPRALPSARHSVRVTLPGDWRAVGLASCGPPQPAAQ